MPKRISDYRDDLLADLRDPGEAALYLQAAMEDSEAMFLVALRDVAEARQMAKVAKLVGIAHKILTPKGSPIHSGLQEIGSTTQFSAGLNCARGNRGSQIQSGYRHGVVPGEMTAGIKLQH